MRVLRNHETELCPLDLLPKVTVGEEMPGSPRHPANKNTGVNSRGLGFKYEGVWYKSRAIVLVDQRKPVRPQPCTKNYRKQGTLRSGKGLPQREHMDGLLANNKWPLLTSVHTNNIVWTEQLGV